jgi:Mrp family chromosome partitioning ATPase
MLEGPGGERPQSVVEAGRAPGELAQATPREWLLPGADELFRSIYTRVGADGGTTLAVCSAIAGEGKTTVALGLAVTIAQDYPELRIALVETDFQRPVLAQDFAVESRPGLIDCIVEDLPPESAIRSTFLPNLYLLPAGGSGQPVGRVLRWSRMAITMAVLRESFDILILDLPAILVNSDALPLTDFAEAVLFVVRAGVTPASLVNKAIAQLDDSREKLRGVVINDSHSNLPGWLRRLCGLWDAGSL